MNPTLTVSQLVVLGAATVAGSFALNAALIKYVGAQVKSELAHLAQLLEAPDGLLVRTAQLETRLDAINYLDRLTERP